MTAHDSHPAPDAPTDQPFERSVAFCLRAYPQRWRATRSAEVTAVLADLTGPPPRRLDARAAAGLVRGGWATRWREHPPLGAYLRYRLLDRPLPMRYRAWVRADIEGPLFPMRRVLWVWGLVIPVILVLPRVMVALDGRLASDGSVPVPPITILTVLVIGATSLLFCRAWRAQAARRFLVLRPGDPVSVGDLVEGLGPQRRLDARGRLTAALVVVSVAATAWTCAALVAPKVIGGVPCGQSTDDGAPWCTELVARPVGAARGGLTLVFVLAALIGLASVVVVRRRLGRLVATVPPQPHREIVGPSASTMLVVTVLSAFVLADAWLEATGQLVILASGVLGPIALLVLPGVIVSWRFVRTSSDARDLAGSDVLTMAVSGRAPEVDRLRYGVVPVIGEVPPGTVMPAR